MLKAAIDLRSKPTLADLFLQTLVSTHKPVGPKQPGIDANNICDLVDEGLRMSEVTGLPPLVPSHGL